MTHNWDITFSEVESYSVGTIKYYTGVTASLSSAKMY